MLAALRLQDRPAKCIRTMAQGLAFLLAASLGLAVGTSVFASDAPRWWTARGVLDSNAVPNDHAPVNQGQAKWMATQAKAELDAVLASGAGPAIEALVGGFSPGNNNLPLNLGQLKFMAKPFYDRIREEGYAAALPLWLPGLYPWTDVPQDDVDFSIANLGQLKYVFSFDFDLCVDSDGDGMSDGFEFRNNLNANNPADAAQASLNPLAHGLTNLQVAQNPSVLRADNFSTLNDGIPDWWKVQQSIPLAQAVADDDADSDGFTTAEEYARGSDPAHDDRVGMYIRSISGWYPKFGIDTFSPTNPRRRYSRLEESWSGYADGTLGLGDGTLSKIVDRMTGNAVTAMTGVQIQANVSLAYKPEATLTPTSQSGPARVWEGTVWNPQQCAWENYSENGSIQLTRNLYDEFTTEELWATSCVAMTSSLVGDFWLADELTDLDDVANALLSGEDLGISAKGAVYKFNLDTAEKSVNLAWIETFTPDGDPEGTIETIRTWSGSGAAKETPVFTNNPLAVAFRHEGSSSIRVLHVDLDIDSENTAGTEAPPRTERVDALEDVATAANPGKLIYMNDMDVDGDSIPDFVDGFGRVNHPDGYEGVVEDAAFSQLVLDCPLPDGVDPAKVRIELICSAPSDPGQVASMSLESAKELGVASATGNPLGSGIRLWTKDASQPRNPASIAQGGDYVPANTRLNYEVLMGEGVPKTLYVEGIGTSTTWGGSKIEVRLYPSTDQPGSFCSDRVSYTVVRCVYKVCVWRPYVCVRDADGAIVSRNAFRADYGSPHALLGSYLDGQTRFDDAGAGLHGTAAFMGHAFARLEVRSPTHPNGMNIWTGQTGMDDKKNIKGGYGALRSGTFWWFRADDGVEDKDTKLGGLYNQLFDNPDAPRVIDGAASKRMLAIREYRLRPETCEFLAAYRETHSFLGYGLDTVLNANPSGSRVGCGSYIGLLTEYAGIPGIDNWRVDRMMPQVPLPNVSVNLTQLLLWDYLLQYRLFKINGPLAECFETIKAAAESDIINSGVMEQWGESSPSFPLRRLMFCDPAMMTDWIDSENQRTAHRNDYGVTVRSGRTQVSNLSEWRGRP